MLLQADAPGKPPFSFVAAALLTTGLVGSLLMVRRLLIGSVAPADIIPSGAILVIRLTRPLTSRTAQLGDRFQARLEAVDGAAGIPPNLSVEGQCLAARKAQRGQGGGYLRLGLLRLRDRRGHTVQIQTTTHSRWGGRVLGTDTSRGAALRVTGRDSGLQLAQESGSREAVVNADERLTFELIEPLIVKVHRGHL